jgi:predicted ABC-type transport system involved in lysophospholipase L1 biosynthesis ATPase subunit
LRNSVSVLLRHYELDRLGKFSRRDARYINARAHAASIPLYHAFGGRATDFFGAYLSAGNLDERTAERLHDLLFELNDRLGQTFVIVTHNRELAARCGRTLLLEHGVLNEAI